MFTATFTDPQGVEHVDAVFQVADANYHSNETLNFNFRLSTADQLGETFYVNDLDPAYDGLTLEQKAEKHCQEVVLATM